MFDRHSRPETPKDLVSHACIRWRWPGRTTPYSWEFFADGAWFEVDVKGPPVLSEQSMTIDAAVDGIGIAFWMEHELRPLIAKGLLVPLLAEWSAPFPGFYLSYPQERQMAPALRAFIDFIRAKATG